MSDTEKPRPADLATLERELGRRVQELSPAGSGPEARRTVMTALASMLGMYLAGDLAKLGRDRYAASLEVLVGEMLDRVRGVAEIQAVQLRTKLGLHGRRETPQITPTGSPRALGLPPDDMLDSDGEKGVLLSAMGALIHVDEAEWWGLPGWPAARARVTETGLEILVEADPDEGKPEPTVWHVTRAGGSS